eukprot:s3287_g6.t1
MSLCSAVLTLNSSSWKVDWLEGSDLTVLVDHFVEEGGDQSDVLKLLEEMEKGGLAHVLPLDDGLWDEISDQTLLHGICPYSMTNGRDSEVLLQAEAKAAAGAVLPSGGRTSGVVANMELGEQFLSDKIHQEYASEAKAAAGAVLPSGGRTSGVVANVGLGEQFLSDKIHQEYVIFNREQAYPEMMVQFRMR